MNIEELALKDRKTLANLNGIDLLDIIEFLQEDRNQWINQFTKTHNESVEIQKENQELKSQLAGTTHCFDEEEHRELKKQLEDANETIILLKASEPMLNLKRALEKTQQKEFIKYLEDKIKIERKNLEELCKLYKIPKGNNSAYKFAYSYINKMEGILQKYKEIMGVMKNEF